MATSTTSVSGLVSGLDTATIINQLMSIEAQPQDNLKTKLTTSQTTLKSLQDLNAKIAALASSAKDLSSASAWKPLKATSSNDAVSATATSGTAAGSFEVTVVSTAVTHQLTFATTAAGSDHVTGATNDVTLTVGGTPTTITSDGTLNGLVSALNAGGTGVKASTVRLDDGTQRLVVRAATSGAAGAFTLTDSAGADLLGGAGVRAGADAAISVGNDTIHSATNTFTGQLPGVDLTIGSAAVGQTVTVDVTSDMDAVTAKVKGLVDSVNAAIDSITSVTANGTAGTAGVLAGDVMVSSVRTALLNSVYPTDGTSMAQFGLQTDRNGKLVLDTAKLATAYAADPAKVAAAFTSATGSTSGITTAGVTSSTPGFVERVYAVANRASNTYTGTLTSAITGQNSTIKDLTDSISDWDTRLALRRDTLTRQFTALETALSQMQSQSSWLSGQISSLGSGG